MKKETLADAISEAKRFLKRAREFQKRLMMESKQSQRILLMTGCRESAAIRRASMDLSRALSDLRKP